MEKCNLCSKLYPVSALKTMVQIMGRKAYLQKVCPSCQAIAANNPNYYYLENIK
ncbi:MAG: hypothetical protein U9N81_09180 [Bacillota bacterium]|nr:hypothetical protein [Bacillota bacterium]